MMKLALHYGTKILTISFLVLLVSSPVKTFCPTGCHCNDEKLTVHCVSTNLNIVPILLNPGTIGLDLSYNIIQVINNGFDFYRSLAMLNLSNNIIESLGSNSFGYQNKLENLILNNNKLKTIGARALAGLSELKSLDLSQNLIEKIENESFRPLENLTSMDLSFNLLEKMEGEVFAKLGKLKLLNLCNNNIKNITKQLFSHMKSVQVINMCSNNIKYISEEAFSSQGNLRDLILNQNKLVKLQHKSFVGLSSIAYLDLQSNLLETVPSNELNNLVSLEELTLGNNKFNSLSSQSFKKLKNLKHLQISNSQSLELIDEDAFSGLQNLQRLELSYNRKLKTIPLGLFVELINLNYLTLRGNQLTTLGEEMVSSLPLLSLDLRENSLRCNCSLKWLNGLLKTHNSSLQIEDVTCSLPDDLINKRLVDLDEYDLKCYSHLLFIISTTSAGIVLLFLGGISVYMYLIKCKRKKSIVQDTWPEKIVTTWNGSNLDKRIQDEEYTFQSRQAFTQARAPVLWQDISSSATRDDFSSDAYASTTTSTPQEEYKDYRDPVFALTANKIKSKFCHPNSHKYKTITRSFTDSSSSIKDFANSPIDYTYNASKDPRSRDSAISISSSSPFVPQIFSISNDTNSIYHYQNGIESKYLSWKIFDQNLAHSEDIFSHSEDILDRPHKTQHKSTTSHHISRTLRQNSNESKKSSVSSDRVLALNHLYALPNRPNFGYDNENLYDNMV